MSKSKRPPLVADRRTSAKKTTTKRKPAARKKKKVSRKKRGPIGWLFNLIFRLVWGIGWRVTALVAIALGLAVSYYAATLPPVTDLLDATVGLDFSQHVQAGFVGATM